MFQFPGFPCISYVFTYTYPWFSWMGFPIRISADRRIFASPRRFSQLITSFFGFQCQGIHHALFFCLTISTYSVMSDGLFNLSIALVCFCYSLKNNRFDVLIFHQFIFSMQFSRNNSLVFRPVEITRFELVTPCLQGRCSPN